MVGNLAAGGGFSPHPTPEPAHDQPYYSAPADFSSAHAAAPPRPYYIVIPIWPVTGHVAEDHLHKLFIYLTVLGVLFVTAGAVGILFPILFALAIEQLIAWLLVFSGFMSVMQSLLMCGVPGMSSFLLLGILNLGVGIWMLMQPIAGGAMLIFVLSGWLFGQGILKMLMACQISNMSSWPAMLASGLLSIVLAFTILILAPHYGLVLLGIIFGVDILVSGISMMLTACMAYLGKRAYLSRRDPVQPGDLTAASREPLLPGDLASSSA
ncbi:hypothetical protein O6H91_02G046800 [Diphasiastrum complanatum]|uniref:Uncharacterized protein n=1 Tax=Diphasiastrum complanatum TaxID=34168 RepID=A0ACC2EEW2_DIPCM|nr:hypothetical protein O6H91_02G046800 [Diphasiastrum complanatum]